MVADGPEGKDMAFGEMEPLKLGDYALIGLLLASTFVLGLVWFISHLMREDPNPEQDDYVDEPKPS